MLYVTFLLITIIIIIIIIITKYFICTKIAIVFLVFFLCLYGIIINYLVNELKL